ncbi:LCP family protein [Patescibacteria group bacterium]
MPANYYSNSYNSRKKPKKLGKLLKVLFFIILIFVVLIVVFSRTTTVGQNSVLDSLGRLPVIKQFRQILGMENLKGELDDRINFLLLGQGGVGHEGPYLTDTIIFASLKPSTKEIAMFSIPRDFYVEIEKHGWSRINAANSIGETTDYKNGGSGFTAKVLENMFDLPVHYWLRIDFNAFKKIIDDLKGISVCVEHAFIDENYPDKSFGVQTIEFETGCQIMDGDTALMFARSRHGTNGEGSDFARSARQQKIIMSIKNKAFSLGTLTSPEKIYNLITSLKNNIQTNIELAQLPHLLNLIKDTQTDQIKKIVLDNSPYGLLRNSITEDGAYVLIPRAGNLSEIQSLARYIFILKNQSMDPVKVIVLNGSKIRGWAYDVSAYLEQLGFDVLTTSNSPQQTFEKSVIYNLEKNENKEGLTVLKKGLQANVSKYIPEFLNAEQVENFADADYLVVLGCKEDGNCWIEDEIYTQVEDVDSGEVINEE